MTKKIKKKLVGEDGVELKTIGVRVQHSNHSATKARVAFLTEQIAIEQGSFIDLSACVVRAYCVA